MTETTMTIPLNKLLAWEGNVRKTDPDKGIDELAASIAAHGLLQSLVVRKDRRGKYAVIAGRRRLLALESLADAGSIEADRLVACTVLDEEADATEVSLVENVQREPMHPADEFDAFKALIDTGMQVADVAARFGVTEAVVQKRLKLARVSPVLLASYRAGDITLQHVMAFAVTDDPAAQERVWNELPQWQKGHPDAIRDLLTEGEVTAEDKRVKFVTLKAYEKAGGTVRRDLFSEGEEGVFIEDVVLLENLVARKLEKTANAVCKEGWKWVEIRPSFDHDEWSECERRFPELSPLPPEQQAEMDALVEEAAAVANLDELDGDQQDRLDAIHERLDEFDSRETVWTPDILAIAGAVVTLGHDGRAAIHCGYVKPEDAPPESPDGETAGGADGSVAETGKDAHSAALIESLTSHRSAAINAALIERPVIALAATVHAMALQVFHHGYRGDTALQVTAATAPLHRVEGSPAHAAVEAARQRWGERIPGDATDLFAWCLAQPQDRLLDLLAFCAAQTVNAVLLKTERAGANRMRHAGLLADAVKLDMAEWFRPTAANYFGKISKAQIIDALREVKGGAAPAWSGMKKAALADLAEREVAGRGWLPEPLRAPAVASKA